MRELKFRAWSENKMYSWGQILRDRFILQSFFGNEHYTTNPPRYFWERMQFTGLLDKNGKEIYEGDILVIPTIKVLEPSDVGTMDIVQVYWSEFGSWNINKDYTLYDFNLESEIIGNIYENPELIK